MFYQRDVIPCQEGNAALDNIPGGLAQSRGVFFSWGVYSGVWRDGAGYGGKSPPENFQRIMAKAPSGVFNGERLCFGRATLGILGHTLTLQVKSNF